MPTPARIAPMRSICGAALVIAATIAGCVDGDGLPTGRFFENRTGTDRTWTLTGFAKPPQPMTKPAARATLRLDANGAMTVETGCRTLVGHWATTADEVHPTDLNVAPGASGADCPAQLIDQDDQISGIAGTGFAVHVDDSTLPGTSNDGR